MINPGGGWTSKRWPPQQYATLIRALAEDDAVLVTGSPGEEPWIREIVESAATGRARYFPSTLLEFIALVRRARLLVGGDTGPLHLAAAVGTPVVAIYGPTNPRRNGPFAAGDIVLTNHPDSSPPPRTHWNRMQARRPGYLEGVPTEDVLAAVRRRLAAADGA